MFKPLVRVILQQCYRLEILPNAKVKTLKDGSIAINDPSLVKELDFSGKLATIVQTLEQENSYIVKIDKGPNLLVKDNEILKYRMPSVVN